MFDNKYTFTRELIEADTGKVINQHTIMGVFPDGFEVQLLVDEALNFLDGEGITRQDLYEYLAEVLET